MKWPFGGLRPFGYRVILADPPWQFELYSQKGEAKSPQAHYRTMATDEIAALPVGHLASAPAVLALWATFPMLKEALAVMETWGFRYVTGGPWAKRSKGGGSWQFGPGYVLRSAAELFLIGKIGSPSQRSRSERNLIVAPAGRHSEKPEALHVMLERMFDGPYVELFARRRRPGWQAWGDELDGAAGERGCPEPSPSELGQQPSLLSSIGPSPS